MNIFKTIIISMIFFAQLAFGQSTPFSQRPDVKLFIQNMVENDHIPATELNTLLNQVVIQKKILELVSAPKEGKPWYVYRANFLNTDRIEKGVVFWAAHEETLSRAEKEYGVPASIIVAILGVETDYGKHQGHYRVLDALATLAFEYPLRAPFFKKELETFLLLCHEHSVDPLSLRGSYAGAFGQPQFMPSSYRSFAVDFSGLGLKDIQNSTIDSIGSVANYFQKHGWQRGAPVAITARYQGSHLHSLDSSAHHKLALVQLKPSLSAQDLETYHIKPNRTLPANEKVALMRLETHNQPEYWLGFNNFYTILQYNASANYAMAVYQLSQVLEKQHARQPPKKGYD